ncbi:MAG: sensor histidine kinase [Blautia sp.]
MLTAEHQNPSYNNILQQAKEEITRLIMEQDYIESLSVFDLNGNGFTVGDSPSYISNLSVWKKQSWYSDVIQKKGNFIWVSSDFSGIREQKNKILFARVINKRDTVDGIGILMVVLDNEYLSKMVDSLSNPAIGEFYIYGGESELLFGPETENQEVQEFISEIKAAEKEEIDSKRNGKYFVTGCYDTHMEWNYLCVGMVSAVLSSQWINILIVALVTCFVIIIASYIYSRFSHGVTRELQNLNEIMGRAEDQNFKEEIKIRRIDEFIQLGDAYNRLINRIHILVNEVMREKLNAKQAQLENLQAQINPHFLYNTLDCISWKAMANDQTEIAEMIQCLSKMFRFSLGRGEKEIELSKEVENTRNYLLLQKRRFEDKLVYLIDIPESVMKYRVIKFFLQPLVENSILHGIQSKPEKGYIGISAGEEDRELVICVWDNGTGIDEKQVAVLLDGNTYDNSGKRHRHGIYNVNERLKMRYGEDSALRFENRKNGGTKVTIRIPVEKLRQDD